MRAQLFVLITVLSIVSLSGCSEESTPEAASEGSDHHAPASAAPGSHEDWCGEHGVHESMCTRCNGELIPAFQATGDWCAEHGLPESQCHACNPDLVIERPAPTGT